MKCTLHLSMVHILILRKRINNTVSSGVAKIAKQEHDHIYGLHTWFWLCEILDNDIVALYTESLYSKMVVSHTYNHKLAHPHTGIVSYRLAKLDSCVLRVALHCVRCVSKSIYLRHLYADTTRALHYRFGLCSYGEKVDECVGSLGYRLEDGSFKFGVIA